jgi:hypothetical protein
MPPAMDGADSERKRRKSSVKIEETMGQESRLAAEIAVAEMHRSSTDGPDSVLSPQGSMIKKMEVSGVAKASAESDTTQTSCCVLL